MRTFAAWPRSRTWPERGRGWGMARTWSRTGCRHGRGADMDCFRPGHGRGLDKTTAIMPAYGADIPRPNRDFFADTKTFAGEGVRLVCVKSLRLKAANGGKFAVAKGDKSRQVCCRILPQFDTGADAAGFVGRIVKGMVSSENCPQIGVSWPPLHSEREQPAVESLLI